MTLDGGEWSVSGGLTSSFRAHGEKNQECCHWRSMSPELVLPSTAWVGLSVRQLGHMQALCSHAQMQAQGDKRCEKHEEEEV